MFGKKDKSAAHGERTDVVQNKRITEVGLKSGTNLTIKIPVKEDPMKTVDVFSSYELAIDQNTFLITAPMQGMLLYPLPSDMSVVITYLADSAVFETQAFSGERLKKGDLSYLTMKCDGYVIRNQRRNDFRVGTIMETVLFDSLDSNPSMPENESAAKALINNLSAGGAAIFSDKRPDIGSPIHVAMPPMIFGKEKILMAQVHWVHRIENDFILYKNHMGVRFLFSCPTDREDLRRFVWEYQKEQMKERI
jgi:c-di-GMP-binding flagellar brake protein YcgR